MGGSGSLGLMLSRLALMVQAAVLDGLFLGFFSSFDDGGVTPKVSVGGCHVTNALMVTLVIVMNEEGADLVFEISWQIISSPAGCCFPEFGANARSYLGSACDRVRHGSSHKPLNIYMPIIRTPGKFLIWINTPKREPYRCDLTICQRHSQLYLTQTREW